MSKIQDRAINDLNRLRKDAVMTLVVKHGLSNKDAVQLVSNIMRNTTFSVVDWHRGQDKLDVDSFTINPLG